ncbi:MAG: class D sortase [Acidobacteriia bacterium]|nr:class D sortase [Terriglobia bacterium]
MILRIRAQHFRPQRSQLILGWSGNLLLVIGALLLVYVGYVMVDTRMYQSRETRLFEHASKDLKVSTDAGKNLPLSPRAAPFEEANGVGAMSPGRAVRKGDPVGKIEISTIGLAAMIMEGTDGRTLRHAVGHLPGTPLPGQLGNVVITGHRDTFFRGLRKVTKDDEITLTTLDGSFRYRVDFTEVVTPDDISVLDDSSDATLTLVTCYPFYFVGPAPKRFIVRAHRISG